MTGLLALLLVAVLIVIPAVVVRWTNAAHRRARSHHRALDALGHITSSAPAGRVETTRTTVPFGSTAPPGGKADLGGTGRLATDHLGSQAYVRVVSSDSPAPLPAPRPLTGGWRPTRATGAAPFRRPGAAPEAGFERPGTLPGQVSGRDGVEQVRAFRDDQQEPADEAPQTEAETAADTGAAEAASLEGPAVRILGAGDAPADEDAPGAEDAPADEDGWADEAETGEVPVAADAADIDDEEELEEDEPDGWVADQAVTGEVRILDTGAAPLPAPAWEPSEPSPSRPYEPEPYEPEPYGSEPEPAAVPMGRLVIPAFPEEDPTLEHVVVLGGPPDAPAAPPPGAVAADAGGSPPLTVALPEGPGGTSAGGASDDFGSGNGNGAGEPPTHPVPTVSGDHPSSHDDPSSRDDPSSDDDRSAADNGIGRAPAAPAAPTATTTAADSPAPTAPPFRPRDGRPDTGPSHRRPRTPSRHRARNMATVAVALVVLAAAGLVANQRLASRHQAASPPLPRTPAASSVPVPTTTGRSTPASTAAPSTSTTTTHPPVALVSNSPGMTVYRIVGHAQITLTAIGPCWVDVRRPDANGGDVFVQTMAAGQSHTVQGPLWLRLGNPTAVTIKVGGITVHPPVKQGSPYDVQFR